MLEAGEATTQQPFGAAAGDISPDVGLAISGGVTCVGSNTGSDQSLKSYDPNGNRWSAFTPPFKSIQDPLLTRILH